MRVPPLVLLAAVWGYAGLLGGLVIQEGIAGSFDPSPLLNGLLAFTTVGAVIYGPIITLLLVCWNFIHRTRLIESTVAIAMIIPLVLAAIGAFRHALAT